MSINLDMVSIKWFPRGTDAETTEYFLLRCHSFSSQRSELFDNLSRLNSSLPKLNTKEKVTCYQISCYENACGGVLF